MVVEAVIPALGRVEAEVILADRWGSAWDIRYTISKKLKRLPSRFWRSKDAVAFGLAVLCRCQVLLSYSSRCVPPYTRFSCWLLDRSLVLVPPSDGAEASIAVAAARALGKQGSSFRFRQVCPLTKGGRTRRKMA